ncbi:MAG: DUF1318 domain-containing protein [Thermodesulfobacteriota bacterium]
MKNYQFNPAILLLFIFVYLSACATITVNVFFPAEEVKQAFTELEEEFIDVEKENKNKNTTEPGASIEEPGIKNKVVYKDEPTLKSTKVIPLKKSLSLKVSDAISEIAIAAEDIKSEIKSEILKDPNVVSAYKNRSKRQPSLDEILVGGKAGEGSNGMVVERAALSAAESADVNSENADRKTIINSMAAAIVKINKIEVTPQNIQKVYPEAAEQFAEARREQAPSGTPVQLPSGKWGKKR